MDASTIIQTLIDNWAIVAAVLAALWSVIGAIRKQQWAGLAAPLIGLINAVKALAETLQKAKPAEEEPKIGKDI